MSEKSSHTSRGRFALLYQLSQDFNSSLDLDEVLDRVMDEVIAATRAERGFVALRKPGGGLEFRSARGMDHTDIDDPEFQISRSVVEEVSHHGEGVLTSDAQQDDRFSGRKSVVDLRLRSIICTPLNVADSLLGVIYVDNRLQAGLFTEEHLELLNAISSSAAIAIENARLYQVAVEKGRMERELQMAYRVQSSLIPSEIPVLPGWEFAASWQPAREVAGDFYDFLPCVDGKLGLVIADVTDKGMPAALFMALTRSIVRSSLDRALLPTEGITRANRLICADSAINMPVTLFYCRIAPQGDKLVYVNGGHNPPIHYQAETDDFVALTRTGMFLGFESEAVYEQRTQPIRSGDFIVLYTDGITDANNAAGETFGLDRFRKVLQENRTASASEILTAIEESVQAFIGATAPFDDITLLITKRL